MDDTGFEQQPIRQPENLPGEAPKEVPKTPEITTEKPPIGKPEQAIIDNIEQHSQEDPDAVLKDIAGHKEDSSSETISPSQKPSEETANAKAAINEHEPLKPHEKNSFIDQEGRTHFWSRPLGSESKPDKPDDKVIDMVKGPDGNWTTRSADDPNFFVEKPKDTPNEVDQSTNKDASQTVWEKYHQGVPLGTSDIAELIHQKQPTQNPESSTQSAKESWLKNNTQGPKIIDGSFKDTVKPEGARERWQRSQEANENQGQFNQRTETEKQNTLHSQEEEGARLAGLVHTEEGQQKIDETKAILRNVIEATSRKPTDEHISEGFRYSSPEIAAVAARNEEQKQRWEQYVNDKVENFIHGGKMNNLEADAYFSVITGQEDSHPHSSEEYQQRQKQLEQFYKYLRDISRAQEYQKQENQSLEQRPQFVDERTLSSRGITSAQSRESFSRGWDNVKTERLRNR